MEEGDLDRWCDYGVVVSDGVMCWRGWDTLVGSALWNLLTTVDEAEVRVLRWCSSWTCFPLILVERQRGVDGPTTKQCFCNINIRINIRGWVLVRCLFSRSTKVGRIIVYLVAPEFVIVFDFFAKAALFACCEACVVMLYNHCRRLLRWVV